MGVPIPTQSIGSMEDLFMEYVSVLWLVYGTSTLYYDYYRGILRPARLIGRFLLLQASILRTHEWSRDVVLLLYIGFARESSLTILIDRIPWPVLHTSSGRSTLWWHWIPERTMEQTRSIAVMVHGSWPIWHSISRTSVQNTLTESRFSPAYR